jgi:hypothetical protein
MIAFSLLLWIKNKPKPTKTYIIITQLNPTCTIEHPVNTYPTPAQLNTALLHKGIKRLLWVHPSGGFARVARSPVQAAIIEDRATRF